MWDAMVRPKEPALQDEEIDKLKQIGTLAAPSSAQGGGSRSHEASGERIAIQ
jgi:hypothetical protein